MICPKCDRPLGCDGTHSFSSDGFDCLEADRDRLLALVEKLLYYTVRNANTVELIRRAEAAINPFNPRA